MTKIKAEDINITMNWKLLVGLITLIVSGTIGFMKLRDGQQLQVSEFHQLAKKIDDKMEKIDKVIISDSLQNIEIAAVKDTVATWKAAVTILQLER